MLRKLLKAAAEVSMAQQILGLLLLAGAAGCNSDSERSRHPLPNNGAGGLEMSATEDVPAELAELGRRIGALAPVVRFGTLQGEPGSVLGRPIDVEETGSGEILVLDAMAGEVRAFGPGGDYRRTLVARGRGPREIMNPFSISIIPNAKGPSGEVNERLVVGSHSGIREFLFQSDSLAASRSYQLPDIPLPRDACAMEDALFIRSMRHSDSGLVLKVRDDGRPGPRFAQGYAAGSPLLREELSAGPLVCVPRGGVVVAFTFLPQLVAYDSTGHVRWSTKIPDFKNIWFYELPNGRGRTGVARGLHKGGDLVQVARFVPPDGLLLQVLRVAPADGRSPGRQKVDRTRTFLISLSTGRGTYVGDRLPELIGATANHLWTVEEGPEGQPMIVGYRY